MDELLHCLVGVQLAVVESDAKNLAVAESAAHPESQVAMAVAVWCAPQALAVAPLVEQVVVATVESVALVQVVH